MLLLPDHLQQHIFSTLGEGHYWQAAECFGAKKIYKALKFERKTNKTCQQSAHVGDLDGLKWSHTQGCPWRRTTAAAAAAGHLDCLVFAMKNGAPFSKADCWDAARGGHIACLQFLMQPQWKLKLPHSVCQAAAQGTLPCLQYVHGHFAEWAPGHSFPFNKAAQAAAEAGRLECLQWAHVQGGDSGWNSWDTMTIDKAAQYGHLDCFQYAVESKCPWTSTWTATVAAAGGHLRILKAIFALTKRKEQWNWSVTSAAACSGYLECLQFAHEVAGCPLKDTRPWSWQSCARDAAAGGSLQCLRYTYERGVDFTEYDIAEAAAGNGHLECLQFAHEHGALWSEDVMKRADTFACVKYAHEHGAPWHINVTSMAARRGDFECLKYAHEHGAPWNPHTIHDAVHSASLPCVQYAHEHGAPLNKAYIELYKKDANCRRYVQNALRQLRQKQLA